jgi:hypothetical protein
MDPLTAFVASIIGALISDVKRSRSDLGEHYPESAKGEISSHGWLEMHGRNVTWLVEPGEAVWIESEYLRPIEGNIFHADKMAAVSRAVRGASQRIPFYASYGQIRRIDPEMVAESIQYQRYQVGRPFTTGNKGLDRFLEVGEEEWMAELGEEETAQKQLKKMKRLLDVAVKTQQGDLGRWSAVVRDGNHRVFGSILGGESRVAIRIYDNDVQDLREGLRSGKLRPLQSDLIAKALADTGTKPWWMTKP